MAHVKNIQNCEIEPDSDESQDLNRPLQMATSATSDINQKGNAVAEGVKGVVDQAYIRAAAVSVGNMLSVNSNKHNGVNEGANAATCSGASSKGAPTQDGANAATSGGVDNKGAFTRALENTVDAFNMAGVVPIDMACGSVLEPQVQVQEFHMRQGEDFQVMVSAKKRRRNKIKQSKQVLSEESSDEEQGNDVKRRVVGTASAAGVFIGGAPPPASVRNPENRVETNTLYIKGDSYNFVAAMKRQLKQYQSAIVQICGGDVDTSKWKLTGESLRVEVRNDQQRSKLLSVVEICGKPVLVTEPWSLTAKRNQVSENKLIQPNTYVDAAIRGLKLGVVYGVPADITPDDMRVLAAAVEARRLTPMSRTNVDDQYSVLLSFDDEIPSHVEVTPFLRLKVTAYAPRPMQCRSCWLFGHTAARCRNTIACEHCSIRGHSKLNCISLDDDNKTRCVNCKGRHEASSKLCARYQENLDILLSYSVTPPMNFKKAQEIYARGKKVERWPLRRRAPLLLAERRMRRRSRGGKMGRRDAWMWIGESTQRRRPGLLQKCIHTIQTE